MPTHICKYFKTFYFYDFTINNKDYSVNNQLNISLRL